MIYIYWYTITVINTGSLYVIYTGIPLLWYILVYYCCDIYWFIISVIYTGIPSLWYILVYYPCDIYWYTITDIYWFTITVIYTGIPSLIHTGSLSLWYIILVHHHWCILVPYNKLPQEIVPHTPHTPYRHHVMSVSFWALSSKNVLWCHTISPKGVVWIKHSWRSMPYNWFILVHHHCDRD